jgi:hypothetical protein
VTGAPAENRTCLLIQSVGVMAGQNCEGNKNITAYPSLEYTKLSLIMSIRLEGSESQRSDFREISYLGLTVELVDTFRLRVKSYKNNRHLNTNTYAL